MPAAEIIRIAVAVGLAGVLLWAALSDIRDRRIPNKAVLCLLALFIPWTIADFGATTISALQAAGIALAVTVVLYAFRIFGAGDAKMFSVCALFMGMGYLPYFALATVLAGGVFAAISLGLRPKVMFLLLATRGKLNTGRGIPYGAPIALGAAFTLWAVFIGGLEPYSLTGSPQVTGAQIARDLGAAR